MAKLKAPLDKATVDGLRKLGNDVVKSKAKRAAFLENPKQAFESYGIRDIDASKLDKNVVAMLTDPQFAEAVEKKDIKGIREFVQTSLEGRAQLTRLGTFDFDFDVEVEVEVVVIAIAVFDFAVVATRIPDERELVKRRELVAQAFESLGKKLNR